MSLLATSVISAYSAGNAALSQQKAIYAQNRAREKQLERQLQYDTQNMYNNQREIMAQRQRNSKNISREELEAKDAFASAIAGSGISGNSVDLLSAQIDKDVSQARQENDQRATQQSNRQFLGVINSIDRSKEIISNGVKFDASASTTNSQLAMLSGAVNSYAGQSLIKGLFTGSANKGGSNG